MNVVTGNRAVTGDEMFVNTGDRFRRTKRRSAVTTACTASEMLGIPLGLPTGIGVFEGENTTWPLTCVTVIEVTKNWLSMMVMVDDWPLNSVSLGAVVTLVRRSAWAASRNMNT